MRALTLLVLLMMAMPTTFWPQSTYAAPFFTESFDTDALSNASLYDSSFADYDISNGNIILRYTTSPHAPPVGFECALPPGPVDPDEREIDMHFGGGGSEMSNSFFISYAVGPGGGFSLPLLGYGQSSNSRTKDRTGYIIRFLRHGDGTNEIVFYRNDTGWTKMLKNVWLPANPVTTLRRAVIKHRQNGMHELFATFDTGAPFEKTVTFEDSTYPPVNANRRVQFIAKAHAGIRGPLQYRVDTWAVSDLTFVEPTPPVTKRTARSLKIGAKRRRGSARVIVMSQEVDSALELYRQGDYPRAQEICNQILDVESNNADAFELVGLIAIAQSDFSLAYDRLRLALDLRLDMYGDTHPKTAQSLVHLGRLYAAKDPPRAEEMFVTALDIYEKTLGPDHPEVASLLNDLAMLYQYQEKYVEAVKLFKRAMALLEKKLGPDHPEVATASIRLARLYYDLSRDAEAESMYKSALEKIEKAFGPEAPQVVSILHFLEVFYQARHKDGELMPIYQRLVDLSEKIMGPDHPEVARRLFNLGTLYTDSDPERAEALYIRALEITEKAHGPDHPFMAAGLYNLAQLRHVKGDYAEAETLYNRAWAVYEKSFGPDYKKLPNVFDRLAKLYLAMGRYTESDSCAARAGKIRQLIQSK